MRTVFALLALFALAAPSRGEMASDWVVLKVHHEFMDSDGETTSAIADLKEKAKYQRELSLDAKKIAGIRFLVHWKAPASKIPKFAVKIEARGVVPATNEETFTEIIKLYRETPSFSGWTTADIVGNHLAKFGRVMAWKVTLLQEGKPMASRSSFTWDETAAAAARNKAKS
ncbi:MAG: hypothetical protein IT578_03875 [Verrucomicrobiae bacterium]|nr:hypothetical protein [Verrucomicrobiae bacterium]